MNRRLVLLALLFSITLPLFGNFLQPTIVYADINECNDGNDNDSDGRIDLGIDQNSDTIIDTTERINTADQTCIDTAGECETEQCKTTFDTTRGIYNPNVPISGGKAFNGISFNGVGGAIAGCTNAGKWAVKGVSALFQKELTLDQNINGLMNADNPKVPTNDSAAKAELDRMNNTTECLNGVAYAVAKNLLQKTIGNILSWVNTGLGGNSLYITDTTSYYRNIANDKISQYTKNIQTRNPVFGNALRSAINRQTTGIIDGYADQVMNTPEARAYDEFLGDFTQGGWNAWLNTTQIDSNNPVGALLGAADDLQRSIDQEIQNTRDELQWGDGFFNMKQCEEYSKTEKDERTGEAKCLPGKEKSVTPGSVIAQQTSRAVNSPIVQLELADGINEVLGAWTDAMLNKFINKGLSALQGAGYDSLDPAAFGVGGASNLSTVTTGTIAHQTANGQYSVKDFDISRPQYLDAVIRAQKTYRNQMLDSQTAMQSIVPYTGELDYCLPGPNPTWAQNVDSNFNAFISNLERFDEGPNGFEKFFGAACNLGSFLEDAVGNCSTGVDWAKANDDATYVNDELVLFDRVRNTSQEVASTNYVIRNTLFAFGVIPDYFKELYKVLTEYMKREYSLSYLQNAFETTERLPNHIANNNDGAVGIVDASNKTAAAYAEAANLVSYYEGIQELNTEYRDSIETTAANIAELESIKRELDTLVATAKARYIKERADKGDPIASTTDDNGKTMLCIDRAYVVTPGTINGIPRKAVNSQDQDVINRSRAATDYFYSTLYFTSKQ